jgi:hypothetical protein
LLPPPTHHHLPNSTNSPKKKEMPIVPTTLYDIFPFSKLTQLPDHGDHIFLSALFFHIVYLLSHHLSHPNRHYRSLSLSKQASWCIHICSQVFSVTVLVLSIPTFQQPELALDKLFGTTYYCRCLVAYASGYFLWDTLISIYYIGETGPPFVFHGSACFSVFFLSYLPFAQHYGGVFLLFEASTVFLNIHWFCDKVGMTGSTLQWINGIFLLITFFIVRLCYGSFKMAEFVGMWWIM